MRDHLIGSWCRTLTRAVLAAAVVSTGIACRLTAAEPISGIGPTGEIRKVCGALTFTEGPAADGQGNLFFSDIPNQRIYKLDPAGGLSIFRENSNFANGLMFRADGHLVACEMAGRVVAISPDGSEVRPLAHEFMGRRFNAPNDLVIDRQGGVYFTDPHFRAPNPLPQGNRSVYYIAPDATVTRVIDELPAPNGVILSPDESTLYVVPSQQAEMLAYAVESPGKLGPQRVFCTLAQPEGASNSGGDGLTVDSQGNLYITSALGIQVFDSQGKPLGIIAFPEQPANCTFGGPDLDTLFVTARTSLYACPMQSKGHRFAAEGK